MLKRLSHPYWFAQGDNYGIPYPLDKQTYDRAIEILANTVNIARLENSEKRDAFSRLDRMRK